MGVRGGGGEIRSAEPTATSAGDKPPNGNQLNLRGL